MTKATLTWDRDGHGLFISIDGEKAVVRTTKPAAPGSRPFGVLASGNEIRLKVHRCIKCDQGDDMVFTIEGRLLDATKPLRKELAALCAKVGSSDDSSVTAASSGNDDTPSAR